MRLGVREKVIIFAVLISFVLGVVLTASSIFQQRETLTNELKKRGLSLSRSLASGSVLDVLMEDKESLQEIVRKIKEREEDVVYIVIEDSKGEVLARVGNYNNRGIKVATTNQEEINFFRRGKEGIYEFVVPIVTTGAERKRKGEMEILTEEGSKQKPEEKSHLRKIGTVKLGISTQSVARATNLLIKKNSLLVIIIVAGCTYLIFSVLSRIVVMPLIRMSVFAEKVASHADLTQKIDIQSADEVGKLADAFNKLVDSMHDIISQVRNAAEKVANSAQQMSSSTQEVNASTQEISTAIQQITKGAIVQSERVDETLKIMEKASVALKQMMANAQIATRGVEQASQKAKSGRVSAQETVEKVLCLTDTVTNAAKVIAGLSEKSQQIGEITETIASLADQTHLLALNAAIEAARAGEAGRGFAVVAEEVRKLAEGSAEAVRKIGNLIKSIQAETDKAVSSVEASSKEVAEGKDMVDRIADLLVEINNSVQDASSLTKQIAGATTEQVQGTERVVAAVSQVASVAKETASTAEEVSSSVEEQTTSMQEIATFAQELARLAMELKNVVSKFKLKEAATKTVKEGER